MKMKIKTQSFAAQLKAERQRLGLTQAEAARLLQISPRALWQWEHGEEPMPVTREGALARLRKTKSKRITTQR